VTTLERLVGIAEQYADLAFLGRGGVLRVPLPDGPVSTLRLELPTDEPLRLQSIGLTPRPHMPPAIAVSEWNAWHGERFSGARLLDFDNPSGVVLHTRVGAGGSWAELRFAEPTDVRELALRNVDNENARCDSGLRVLADGVLVYDGAAREAELTAALITCAEGTSLEPLAVVLADTMAADYEKARKTFDGLDLEPDVGTQFRALVSQRVLAARELQWTIHGPMRSFSFWSEQEKRDYIAHTMRVLEDLRALTPNVCLGFGSVLAVVRDHEPIPHDDDLDIIIGFEPDQAPTLTAATRLVGEHLRALGYQVSGRYVAHRHVTKDGMPNVDVFSGIFEGDTIAWYPGRRGSLTRSMMFPPSSASLLDVPVLLPHEPEQYLEQVYGPSWRVPDPGFQHTWDAGANYQDLVEQPPA